MILNNILSLTGTLLCILFVYTLLKQFWILVVIFNLKYSNKKKSLFQMYIDWRFSSSQMIDRINAFPFSYFLYKIDARDYEAESEEIKRLYQQKFKYEKIVWILFILFLLAIPLMEYVITPYLLKK